jgi:Zn-dependent peptidase ImmA (M78 family)
MPAASSTTTDAAREAPVRRLVGRTANADARERLRTILDGWRREFAQTKLPVDVIGLASAHGIRVTPAAGDWEGRVYADEAGRVTIEVDPRHALVRQRFTVAHELVHTAFPGFVREHRYRVDTDLENALFARTRSEEERLCDWGAGLLLMPDELIWSYRADQGLRAVERLARDAKVSLEAAALRLVDRHTKPTAFLVIDPSPDGLRVRYTHVSKFRLFVPRGAAVLPTSVFARAAKTGKRELGVEPLPGRSRRLVHIEAKCYPTTSGASTRERLLAFASPRG